MEGWLFKKGGFLSSRKQQRLWFELSTTENNSTLTCYNKPPKTSKDDLKQRSSFLKSLRGTSSDGPVLSIEINGSQIEVEDDVLEQTEAGTSKSIDIPQYKIRILKNKKALVLFADSKQELNKWTEAFTKTPEVAIKKIQIDPESRVSKEILVEEWNKNQEEALRDYSKAAIESINSNNNIEDEDDQINSEDQEIMTDEELIDFFSIQVDDKNGQPVLLKNIIGKTTPTLVVLLRHFGCILCRQLCGYILQRKMDFYNLGIPIIAISTGTPASARNFIKEFKFPGRIYLDQKRTLYKVLSCKRGVKYSLSRKTLSVTRKAFEEGYKQGPNQGDMFQLGGVFVVSQKNGFIFQHRDSYAGNHPDLDKMIDFLEKYLIENPTECWSNKPPINKEWSQVVNTETSGNMIKTKSEELRIESGKNNVIYSSKKLMIENSEQDIPYYQTHFDDKPHLIFVNNGKENPDFGPFSLVLGVSNNSDTKAILYTVHGDYRFVIPSDQSRSDKDAIQYIKQVFPEIATLKLNEADISTASSSLKKFENSMTLKRYKFGLLYGKSGQTETEMYSNENGSKEFDEFAEFLGEKIELKGWQKYSGGLSTNNGLHGKQAIYTTIHNDFEVIFHVSTYLPYVVGDPQKIDRKRHLGNDVVIIIFLEGNEPFDPTCIRSSFNHVYVVVQVDRVENGETYYKVCIACKPGVTPFGPYLPFPAIFKKGEDFRQFLITKLINGERASMNAPLFVNRIRLRRNLLESMANDSIIERRGFRAATATFLGNSRGSFVPAEKKSDKEESPKIPTKNGQLSAPGSPKQLSATESAKLINERDMWMQRARDLEKKLKDLEQKYHQAKQELATFKSERSRSNSESSAMANPFVYSGESFDISSQANSQPYTDADSLTDKNMLEDVANDQSVLENYQKFRNALESRVAGLTPSSLQSTVDSEEEQEVLDCDVCAYPRKDTES